MSTLFAKHSDEKTKEKQKKSKKCDTKHCLYIFRQFACNPRQSDWNLPIVSTWTRSA